MNRSETHFCPHLAAPGGREQNKSLRFVSSAHQNESLEGIKDGKVILPAWLGTCTLPHRCSLFTGAAINLHARGYESTARRRAEFKSQKEFFKVNGSEQGSSLSDQIEQLSCMSGLADASLWRRWAAVLLTDILKMLIDTQRSGTFNRRKFPPLLETPKIPQGAATTTLASLLA